MKEVRAAIYARKSNDDDHKCPDNKSVWRQIERGKEFAARHGWPVSEDNIYVDDGITGVEFNKRDGLSALRRNVGNYDVIIMSELSRLGRDADRTSYEVVSLLEKGKRIFYYLTGEEEKADTAIAKMMLRLRGFAAEIEREKMSERVLDTLTRIAAKGHVAGRAPYGYDIRRLEGLSNNGEYTKSNGEYVINPDESKVVVAIYEMYRDGYGYKAIAKTLSGDSKHADLLRRYFSGVSPKPPGKQISRGWSGATVRDILTNEKYHGDVTYGKHRSAYKGGSKVIIKSDDYIRKHRPEIKIVPDDLWDAVQERLAVTNKAYSKSQDGEFPFLRSVGTERDSKYLLSSLCTCGECRGSYVAAGGTSGSGTSRKAYYKYACSTRHNKGDSACSNDHRVRLDDLDNAVLKAINDQILSAEAIEYVIDKAAQMIAEAEQQFPDKTGVLSKEIVRMENELERMIGLVIDGANSSILAARINSAEEKLKALKDEYRRLETLKQRNRFDAAAIRKYLSEQMTKFGELMRRNVASARKALKALLTEKIVITPHVRDGRKYLAFQGSTTAGLLTAGLDEENHIGCDSGWASKRK